MPIQAVEKPIDEKQPAEDSATSDSDDDDSPPELEETDPASLQQQSQVSLKLFLLSLKKNPLSTEFILINGKMQA